MLKVDLVFDSPREQGAEAPGSRRRPLRRSSLPSTLLLSGRIGERSVAMAVPRIPTLVARKVTGTFGPLHLNATLIRSQINASIGLDPARVILSRVGSMHTLQGQRAGDAVAYEIIERYRGPFDIRHVGPGGYVDLELRAAAPFTLIGECEAAIDAILVAFAVPTVLRSSAGFGRGAGATPSTWTTGR